MLVAERRKSQPKANPPSAEVAVKQEEEASDGEFSEIRARCSAAEGRAASLLQELQEHEVKIKDLEAEIVTSGALSQQS